MSGFRIAVMAPIFAMWMALGAPGLATTDAQAQSGSPPPAPEASAAQPAAAQTREELRDLLETLRDDQKREVLASQIEGLLAVQETAPKQEELGIGAQILAAVSAGLNRFGTFVDRTDRALSDTQHLWGWLQQQVLDPAKRAIWLQALTDIALTIGGGMLAVYGIKLALTVPRRQLAGRVDGSVFRRIRFSAARFALDLLPVIAFVVVAVSILGWLRPPETTRLLVLAFINATLVSLVALVIGRWLFSPMSPELRIVPMRDATAVYLYIWTRRAVLILVWGYVLLQAALLLGMPPGGHAAAVKILGLIVAALAAILVLQNRETVAHRIRGRHADSAAGRTAIGPTRGRIAEIWHVAALLYIVGVYVVWALEVPHGFGYLARASAITFVVAAAVAMGEALVPRLFDRLSGIDAALSARYPFIAARTNRYVPILRRALVIAVRLVAVLVVLAAWQVGVSDILLSETGLDVLGRLADIAIVIVLSLIAWEIASGLITAQLNRRDAEGKTMLRSARTRTLLPLIRNALMIVISVMAILIVLSEIGVDIAPLLAGAGVVGLAVGFGAQSLVKDVITGAFILFEDSINIGDVVEVGGKSGVVEAMTVRAIRLRDLTGNVHTLPFGAIETVTNMTRDFSYYLLDIGVAYRESTDEVSDILREIDAEMRADPKYAAEILEPVEILGVDRFEDSAVILRARVKTRPIEQWDVGREFNRRIKMKFDERGIEMPFPHRTIYFGEDKARNAPPARVALRKD